jgi:ABC-type transport system substrate-binding protein
LTAGIAHEIKNPLNFVNNFADLSVELLDECGRGARAALAAERPRESHYMMVDTVEALDPTTVVFHLKFATAAFLPALADPFSWIYKKEILDKDPRWYEKNILGSGPFKFAAIETGQSIKEVKNPDYYQKGLPYLDRFTAIYADKHAVRVEAIRSDRAAIEFLVKDEGTAAEFA